MNWDDKHRWGESVKISKYEKHKTCKRCGATQIKTPYTTLNVRNGRFDVVCVDIAKENLKTID